MVARPESGEGMDPVLIAALAAAEGGGFTVARVARREFDAQLLAPLHALANELMSEPFDHFQHHAHTNDELHVFRRPGADEVEGFQFWRALDGGGGRRVVLGGKLRVRPRARRRGLHLVSGLAFLLAERRRHPGASITRIGVASLFGFVSIARRLARFDFVDAVGPRRDLLPVVDELTAVSGFHLDPKTGQVDVGIFMTEAQRAGYPASFYASPEARAYIARNPGYAGNGRYLAFAFDVDRANVEAMAQGTAARVLGAGAEADAVARRVVDAFAATGSLA